MNDHDLEFAGSPMKTLPVELEIWFSLQAINFSYCTSRTILHDKNHEIIYSVDSVGYLLFLWM